MFGYAKVAQLESDNEKLVGENQRLRQEVDRLLEVTNNSIVNAEAYFDFKNMRVFSVERNVNGNKPCTIIGYLLKEPVLSSDGEMIVEKDVVREWYLYCNEERHQQLVNQFKESVK